MGVDASEKYVQEGMRNLRFTPLWFKMKCARWIKKWRLLLLWYGPHTIYPTFASCSISPAFDAGAEHFKKYGWVFIENIFNEDFHRELVKNWPKKHHFDPPQEVEKKYNMGFKWRYDDVAPFRYSDPHQQYPMLVKLKEYLSSKEFCERMRTFNGANDEMLFYSCILNDSGPGAEVVPHRDGIRNHPHAETVVNMIFFIDATGGERSGGLTLSRDPELKEILFEPTNLTNTCLIYNIMDDFYHGFPPIARGKFRLVITAQFCGKGFIEHQPKQ